MRTNSRFFNFTVQNNFDISYGNEAILKLNLVKYNSKTYDETVSRKYVLGQILLSKGYVLIVKLSKISLSCVHMRKCRIGLP